MKYSDFDITTAKWGDVSAKSAYDIAILPWSSTEPHNRHLPYCTDMLASQAIAFEAAEAASALGVSVMLHYYPELVKMSLAGPGKSRGFDIESLNKKVALAFDHAEGLTTSDGKEVIGFEVAGEDKVYYEASAGIKNDKVILKVNADVIPKYIRYAWKPFKRANLINGDGLPASTFEFKNK